MRLEYEDINSAIDYYGIDKKKYKEECYSCIDKINGNVNILDKVNDIYNLLYIDKSDEYKKLWKIKKISEIFGQEYPKFITNVLLLLGYKFHIENIEKMKLNEEQLKIQKQRVKECFENDIINKNYEEIRISQMLWGTYFINCRIIEVGRLQFEPTDNNIIKIHIPSGEKLEIEKVVKSVEDSRILLKKYYNIENPQYICESWLLSEKIVQLLDENSNIIKFQELFDIKQDKNGIDDILNFVFSLRECDNYTKLQEDTTLQKRIKEFLINGGTIYNGYGVLKI